jgi:hypothetical protein
VLCVPVISLLLSLFLLRFPSFHQAYMRFLLNLGQLLHAQTPSHDSDSVAVGRH